jgi:hypothetical protein
VLITLLVHESTHATDNETDPAITDPDKQNACWEVEAYCAELDFLCGLLESPLYCCGLIGDCLSMIKGFREDLKFDYLLECL